MISIDPASVSTRDNYKLLIGSIAPRPIAMVTTMNRDGVLNAAPFSFFNIVTANPPMVSIAVQRKPDGTRKDTAANAVAGGEFVVHVADEGYGEQMNRTAASIPSEESEVELAGLTPVASSKIKVPGIAEAKVRMECVLERVVELGGDEAGAPSCDLLIGRVVCFHVDETIYEAGRIDAAALRPLSRLAGDDYARLGERFTMERPL